MSGPDPAHPSQTNGDMGKGLPLFVYNPHLLARPPPSPIPFESFFRHI